MEKLNKKVNEHIQVYVRVRPTNVRERALKSMEMVEVANNKEVLLKNISDVKLSKKFVFDKVFDQNSKQNDVYRSVVSPMIEEVLAGYNCTVFAYGQTGTGKTYTMVGEEAPELKSAWDDDDMVGMIPRAVNHMFDELRLMGVEFSMRISYLELYNEELFDLLSPDETAKIRIFEDSNKKGCVIVHGLEEIPVHSKNDVYKLLAKGQNKRKTAPTLMNAQSSRSHTIFSIVVHIKDSKAEGEEMLKIGKLNLVDLAGSENISKAGNEKGVRARETVNINQSLLTLGRVMTALVEHKPHVPYRESKLTRLLQESLGGRTKTSIIATISPGHKDFEETANTLDYAHRAKNIQNRPEVNQRLTKKTVMKEFTEEIDRLKRDLMAARNKDGIFLTEETYNEMLINSENTTKELNEKLMLIRALKDEMLKKEQLFNEVSLNLIEKSEQLKATDEELVQTKEHLEETEENLKKQKYLVKHHVKAETKLFGQAQQLLNVADEAATHVKCLHENIDQRKRIEITNKTTANDFSRKMVDKFQTLDERAENFKDELNRKTTSFLQNIDEGMAFEEENSQKLNVQLQQLMKINSSIESQLFAVVENMCQSSKIPITDLLKLTDVLKDQMEFSKLFKDCFDNITKQCQSVRDLKVKINQDSNEFASNVMKATEEEYEEIKSDLTDVESLTDNVVQNDQTLNLILAEIEKIKESNQLQKDRIGNIVDNIRQRNETKVPKAKEQCSNFQNNLAQKSSQVEEKVAEIENLVEKARSVDEKNYNFLMENQKEMKSNVNQLQTEVSEFHNQYKIEKELFSNAFNGVSKELEQTQLERDSSHQKYSNEQKNQLSAIDHSVEEFFEEYNEFSDNCQSNIQTFCGSDLNVYNSTGQTPIRKSFQYPKQLTKASPHERILRAFRPNIDDSFNTSVVSLPEETDGEIKEEQANSSLEVEEIQGFSNLLNDENNDPNMPSPRILANKKLNEIRASSVIVISSDEETAEPSKKSPLSE